MARPARFIFMSAFDMNAQADMVGEIASLSPVVAVEGLDVHSQPALDRFNSRLIDAGTLIEALGWGDPRWNDRGYRPLFKAAEGFRLPLIPLGLHGSRSAVDAWARHEADCPAMAQRLLSPSDETGRPVVAVTNPWDAVEMAGILRQLRPGVAIVRVAWWHFEEFPDPSLGDAFVYGPRPQAC